MHPFHAHVRVLAVLAVVLLVTAGSSAAFAHGPRSAPRSVSMHGTSAGATAAQGCPSVVREARGWWRRTGGASWTRALRCPDRPDTSTPPAPQPPPTPAPTAVEPATPDPAEPEPTTPEPTTPEPTTPEPTTPSSPGPSGSGCADDPSSCGYPDASNTGVPDGVDLKASGSIDATKDGQVIDGLDVTGEINVTAKNVTIKNTRVTGGRGAGASDWVVIVRPGADNLTIQDSEIRTPEGTEQDLACIFNIGDSKPTITRVDLHACSQGVSSGGGLIEDSYVHDLSWVPGLSHVVGVASNGGGGMTLRHNTIFNQFEQTAAIAFYQDFGTQQDNLVEDNLLAGGGYCVYGGGGQFGGTADIRFIDNRFSRKYSPDCGQYGVVAWFTRSDPGNAWTGNYWDEDLSPVRD